MDYSPPGSSVRGIFQARTLEQVTISSSRESSWPSDGTHVFCIVRQILYCWATSKDHIFLCTLFIVCLPPLEGEAHEVWSPAWTCICWMNECIYSAWCLDLRETPMLSQACTLSTQNCGPGNSGLAAPWFLVDAAFQWTWTLPPSHSVWQWLLAGIPGRILMPTPEKKLLWLSPEPIIHHHHKPACMLGKFPQQ